MKKRIFVIEKDDDILHIIEHILQEEGYEVFTSTTEFGIFEQIKKSKPHVILLDVINTTPRGTELCRAIKAANEIRHIPVIVLSTHLKADVMKEVCADEIVPKPFDINKLIQIVESQLLTT